MRFLTPTQCVEWCAQHSYPAGPQEHYTVPKADKNPEGFHFAEFTLPGDSGRKVALARSLYSLIDSNSELLLWLGEWSVWPSSGHMPLFTRFRSAFGEHRNLIDAPGHLVTPLERDDGIAVVLLSLVFVWDCHVISSSGRDALFISHDEYGWFGSRDAADAGSAAQKLRPFIDQ